MLAMVAVQPVKSQNTTHRLVFWNVENYFDTRNDSLVNDDSFTPLGMNRWSRNRFENKRNNIFKTLVAVATFGHTSDSVPLNHCMPLVVGLCEVENKYVLDELCYATPLRRFGYKYVHFDSPDQRGVDCALLYREHLFRPFLTKPLFVSDTSSTSSDQYFTRDILLVGGALPNGDTLFVLVNHWPSKLGGAAAVNRRLRVADSLYSCMQRLCQQYPHALVVAMGDFNAEAVDQPVAQGLRFAQSNVNPLGFVNLMHGKSGPQCSYKYRDQWSCIDQLMVRIPHGIACGIGKSGVAALDFLLTDDMRYLGLKPFRTYSGYRYIGGYSDHLPVFVDLLY